MWHALRAAMILSLVAALAACGSSSDQGKSDSAQPDAAKSHAWYEWGSHPPIQIAAVAPMSGKLSRAGNELIDGVVQATDVLTTQGGVVDTVVTLHRTDDRCDPTYAQAVARGLALQHVNIVVGHLCPAATLAAAPIYSESNILLLAPTTTDPALTDDAAARGSIDIIRVAPRDDAQGAVLAKHILAHYPGASVALVQDGTPYGRTIVDATRNALAAAGVRPVLDETVVPAPEADASLVGRLKAAQASVVIYGGTAADGAALLLEMRRGGLKSAFGGGNSLFAPDFWHLAGSAAEGAFTAWLPDPVSIMKGTYQPIVTNSGGVMGGLGTGVTGYTLYAYAAVQVFAEAAQRAKSLDPLVVAKAIREGSYDTVLGRLSFDAKGDARGLGFTIYAWHDGGYVTFE
jgi:branched-chain amino acid transport system substrate-binding protein